VPITANLTLKEGGLLNTVFGLLGGKKYESCLYGYIRVGVRGISIKVPVHKSRNKIALTLKRKLKRYLRAMLEVLVNRFFAYCGTCRVLRIDANTGKTRS